MVTLSHLRTMEKDLNLEENKKARLIAEFLDPNNSDLAKTVDYHISIVSTRLMSCYVVQTILQPERTDVLAELLDPRGSEIAVLPVELLMDVPETGTTFGELMMEAKTRKLITIGFKNSEQNKGKSKIEINPKKSEEVKRGAIVACLGDIYQ